MTKNKLYILFIIYFFSIAVNSFSQFTNYRIYPSVSNQIEPFIVRHPVNQNILFASAYTIYLNFRSEGIYVSTDGGNSWRGTDTCNGAPINGGHGGDPGPIIDKDGNFILTHQGGAVVGMFANYSTNQGLNWSNNIAILTGDQDKGSPGTDDAPASPYYGRTYLVWTRFSPPFPIVISYTTNGGQSWLTGSSIIQINNSYGSNRSFGPAVNVSPEGKVYVCWASAIPNSPYTEDYIGFAKSTNGGNNWAVVENAIDINGIRTTQLNPWTIRANSFPVIDVDKTGGARNGWIYIVTTSKNLAPAGSDPDIVLYVSTNEGVSWSSGVRVNQDPINNGRNQFFPAVRVDENGGVNIIYYDNRNSVDSVDVYLSRSTNGGSSWQDFKITANRFKPTAVAGAGGAGNMGDNIGLTSGNGKLYAVWMSNQTGIFQTWACNIDYAAIGIHKISSEIPAEFMLEQNYPNPFNPVTKIKFHLPVSSFVKLSVYDINGREASVITEQYYSNGSYEASFDGSVLPSGIYFYKLQANEFSQSKKMIILK
jgi:hypothetical protein